MKLESYAHWNKTARRKPLRSSKEIAAMLGLTMAQLRGYLAIYGAPKPVMVNKGGSWYEPDQFKKWFDGLSYRIN